MVGRVRPRICFMDLEATALEADVGHLVGAGFMDEGGRFRWFYARTPREEERAVEEAVEYLTRHHIVFTWSGSRFDLPFLATRALRLGLKAEEVFKPTHVDLAEFVRSSLKLAHTSLYHVARFLGIAKDLSVEGIDVPSLYLRAVKGDKRAAAMIKRHCRDDLEVLRKVYLKLLPILREVKPELTL